MVLLRRRRWCCSSNVFEKLKKGAGLKPALFYSQFLTPLSSIIVFTSFKGSGF